MKLSPQKKKLIELYKDGQWRCSVEIAPLFIRDYRKRLSELNKEGYVFKSIACDGRCGVRHSANVHMYRLEGQPAKRVTYVPHPITRQPITTEQFAKL
jgi:hypothetical protein